MIETSLDTMLFMFNVFKLTLSIKLQTASYFGDLQYPFVCYFKLSYGKPGAIDEVNKRVLIDDS